MGMFTVVKKGNRLGNTRRLIVDCRQANSLLRRPPTTSLATPAGLTSLDMSKSALMGGGDGETLNDIIPNAETGDVGDCFYNFFLEEACSWFSTGDRLTVQELRDRGFAVDEIFDDESKGFVPVRPDEQLYICFRGVPMGWSWALYFAQEIVSWQCLQACEAEPNRLVRDRHVPPDLGNGEPAVGVYVDNVHVFSSQQNAASAN